MSIILFAFAVSAITFTVTTTSIFTWLRELVSRIHHKFEELIHCPWCLSFWLTLLLVLLSNDVILLISKFYIVNLFLTIFAVMSISGVIHYVLLRAYEPVAANMARRAIEKMKKSSKQS